MTRLLGNDKESFTISIRLAKNSLSIASRALIDTGANGLAFIDAHLAGLLTKNFQTSLVALNDPLRVRGFNGTEAQPIRQALALHLLVDGRQCMDMPFLVTDLGKHEVILGKKWLAENRVLPDCYRQRLIWPRERSLKEELVSKHFMGVPRSILKKPSTSRTHQEDVARRDRLWTKEEASSDQPCTKQPTLPTTYGCTYKRSLEASLACMNRALNGADKGPSEPERKPCLPRPRRDWRSNAKRAAELDIAFIGAVGFSRHTRQRGMELCTTSLHEIDKRIEELENPGGLEDPEIDEIKKQLPERYWEYADVFQKSKSDELPPHKPYDHKIELEGERDLGYSPIYRLGREELEAAKEYIIDNLNKGFIVASQAPFASPILMAKKPGGGLRFCVDYRKLNSITKKDRYPLPLIDEVFERLSKARIFTKLDIRQGFHRIRMHQESEDLTTFRCRYGTFKYKVMPFGVTNGPATFQRLINDIFMDCLDDFLIAFVDDLLIYSDNELEHEAHVKKVLERLREAGLQAAIHKCEFHVTTTKYLGFIVTPDGIKVDPSKIEAVVAWAVPTTVQGVQSFLGFCNFYRKFIEAYSRIAAPLYRLTRIDILFI